MGRYRLSARARDDLVSILRFGLTHFGAYQAEAYHAGLERTFGLLADFPAMAPRREGVSRPIRRFQAHFVYYAEEKGFVGVVAVLHHAQDWRRRLR